MDKIRIRLSSSQIIIYGFAGVILIGCFLLMLPVASRDGSSADFLDALFTATSAVCVTGLVVQDTATYWSAFGQAVILMLIQIGGMGVITVALALVVLSKRHIDLQERLTMQVAISAPKTEGIVKLTGFIIKQSLFFEFVGAAVMIPVFCKEFGFFRGIWYAAFHSISAFCNAGFDLMGIHTPYESLTSFANEPVINMAVMTLIIIGGIGFTTWDDIKTNRYHFRRYRMQSKIILLMTIVLIIIPTLFFFFLEFENMPMGERVWTSLFQAVTPRTAGFNTTDLTGISEAGRGLIMMLMLIGGSPGSTAGGMKTTTAAVMVSTAVSVFRRREHTHFFGRRINDDVIRNAATILMMYVVLFLAGGFIISRIEGLPLLTCLFETASAIGTVGLSLGITQGLGIISKLILIFLMYTGRVGCLTLVYSAVSGRQGNTSRLPMEKLAVG